ncbi:MULTISPECIES: guanitoxin biosynthesis heme-dependent pre-guanitoxin N-hydroxylase GntA [unclassified Streptomyces]|uniref:guanitoxin biosynthesis heme-dependent pre-guanitoxin N-hydroxylase GntA n=1 Tax=unclassified Streptomyces TaxID=2593676 RepID=UPI002E29519A|nr:guanitoxin biosynthesis heme-dependent pre-guanitoxin N-hydroxylase GntA [Streptomyces sp. NBC_00190]
MALHGGGGACICTRCTSRQGGTMENPVHRHLADWIMGEDFSCLAAKAAVRRGTLTPVQLGSMGSADATSDLHTAIFEFTKMELSPTENFATLVAVFEEPSALTEPEFDALMWQQLTDLHAVDVEQGFSWAPDVSPDPASPDFAFSLAGHPFFVVGMHANASRISRRYPRPALAFNSNHQFRRLKQSGVYYGLQRRIRQREERLQRSINPNLAEFGEASDARQYSGAATGEQWRCPFHPQDGTASGS